MAVLLNLSPPKASLSCRFTLQDSVRKNLKCSGRISCLFSSDRRKEEQARKALESALGEKKDEFERWSTQIKKREEVVGGGGNASAGRGGGGGGGWFGWGGRFGWSNGDHFWDEAWQISLTVLGLVLLYLIVTKGELMLAVFFNPLLYALRSTRNGLSLVSSKLLGRTSPRKSADLPSLKKDYHKRVSAKERVVRKWGS